MRQFVLLFYALLSSLPLLASFKIQLSSNSALIASSGNSKKRSCIFQCLRESRCALATFSHSSSTCYLFTTSVLSQTMQASNDVDTFIRMTTSAINTNGLINYWPIHNDIMDYVGFADLEPMMNVTYTTDRFNNLNEALVFPGDGYFKLPTGVYVAGNFTLIVWVRIHELKVNAKIFDFGNPGPNDDLQFSLSESATGQPYIAYYINTGEYCQTISNQYASLDVWHHLVAVLDGMQLLLYMDGILVGTESCIPKLIPININRTQCLVGRSNWYPAEEDAYADIDDLKIYSRALSNDEILADMNYEL